MNINLRALAVEKKPTVKQPVCESVLPNDKTARDKLIVQGLHNTISKQIQIWLEQGVSESYVERAFPLMVEVSRGILKENKIDPQRAVELLMGPMAMDTELSAFRRLWKLWRSENE